MIRFSGYSRWSCFRQFLVSPRRDNEGADGAAAAEGITNGTVLMPKMRRLERRLGEKAIGGKNGEQQKVAYGGA